MTQEKYEILSRDQHKCVLTHKLMVSVMMSVMMMMTMSESACVVAPRDAKDSVFGNEMLTTMNTSALTPSQSLQQQQQAAAMCASEMEQACA